MPIENKKIEKLKKIEIENFEPTMFVMVIEIE